VQQLGRVGQQVAVLVDGAPLGRDIAPDRGQRLLQHLPAVDNQELRLEQPAPDEVLANSALSLAGFAAHVFDGQHRGPSTDRFFGFNRRSARCIESPVSAGRPLSP
jgi:hypothetical protein